MTRRRATLVVTTALALSGVALGGLPTSQASTPVSAHLNRLLQGGDSGDFAGAEVPVGDADRRGPSLPPLAAAKEGLKAFGAGVQVSWTPYGTPLNLTKDHAFLATGLSGSPEQVARGFLRSHAAIWGLRAADVDRLQVVINQPMPQSKNAYSISFNQTVRGILVAQDGYVVVGVVEGKVAIVTSSLVPTDVLGAVPTSTAKISVAQAILSAARDAGITGLKTADLTVGTKLTSAGFRSVKAKGLHQNQLARVRVLATTRGAKVVWETVVEDVAGGRALAVSSYVDAATGKVLLRRDGVNTVADSGSTAASVNTIAASASQAKGQGSVQGSYSKSCSAQVPITFTTGDKTVVFSAAAITNPADDIAVNIYKNGVLAANGDTATSPEAATATFSPSLLPTDKITVRVCPFSAAAEDGSPQMWQGAYLTTTAAAPGANLPTPLMNGSATGPATFKAFGSNPQLARPGVISPDDRYTACSGVPGDSANPFAKDLSTCSYVYRDNSRLDYDADPVLGVAGATTAGNNAITTNAQASSSLTPGGPLLPPVDPTRNYASPFTDAWHKSDCDPTSIALPPMADINASIINLFVGHNRIHDFSYRLGLTEARGALQVNNFGVSGTNVAEDDPELGNAQNAALSSSALVAATGSTTGPAAGVGLTGRDNANQITMMDGVPGITNQYLFQPVVGFYAPCTDGDLDATVFLHEYTHAISNRLIAGPATGLSGQQGGSMGESWSDLDAIEYLNAFGLAGNRGEDPFSLGAYATGDPVVGIRDFNLAPSKNPLNYSDFGFDTTGPEVHADGEVWNAVQMTIRENLIKKYDAQYPHTNKVLQKACALGRTATGAVGPTFDKCPGNRHYITYLYDAMILQANGAPSMVDMKNAELAAVMMRYPTDYDVVADSFAARGLGAGSSSKTGADTAPIPSFAAPKAAKNAHLTYKLVDANTGKAVKGSVFVGQFTARCRPVATTLGGAEHGPKAEIIAGTYMISVQAKGYGIQRFTQTYMAGTQTQVLKLAANVASSVYGGSLSGNAGALRLSRVNDDTEVTNAAFDGQPVVGRTIDLKFGGGMQTFDKVAVSSLHHPALPAKGEDAAEFEGRLLGIRAFDLEASSNGGKSFTTIYRSPNDFFPGGKPRATAPDLLLRAVKLAKPVTANAIRLVVRSNACTGNPDFHKESESDPTSASDCTSVATNATRVTITELQVFRSLAKGVAPMVNPPVVRPARPVTAGGPLPATGGSTVLALSSMLLVGLGGVVMVLRRRTV